MVSPVEEPEQDVIRQFNMTSGWDVRGDLFGGNAMDEATDVLVGPDGNVYVAGYTGGRFGQSAVEPSGNAIGVIRKYSSPLSYQSSLLLGEDNSSAEVVEALAVSPSASSWDFDLYFAGRSNGAYAGAHGGQFDTIIGWVELDGDVKKFQYGNEKPQHPRRLFLNDSNDLIVTGFDDIYIPTNFVAAWEDPYVLKVRRTEDALGPAPQGWPYQPASPGSDALSGMTAATTLDAPIYVTGTVFTGPGRGMFVRKILWNGVVEWSQPISSVGLDSAAALATLPDGNLLFAGATFQRLGDTSHGEQDVVLRLLTPQRQTVWTVQRGTPFSELITDMAMDHDGNIYVVGETLGSFDPMVPPQGETDIFVLKLSRDGGVLRSFQIGSPGDDHPTSIAVDRDGHVYVAGYSAGDLFGEGDHSGGRDGFVFRITPPSLGTLGE